MSDFQFQRLGLLRVAVFADGQLRDHVDMRQKKATGFKATEPDVFVGGKLIGRIVRLPNGSTQCGEVWCPAPEGGRPVYGLRYATRHEAVAALYVLTRPYPCSGAGITTIPKSAEASRE